MFPRVCDFLLKHSESESGDEIGHDAFDHSELKEDENKTQRTRKSTNGSGPYSKRACVDRGRSAEIINVRNESIGANGVPELPRRYLDRHLVVYRFSGLPVAHSGLPHTTAAPRLTSSDVDGSLAKTSGDKNFCSDDVRERAWRTLVSA